MSVHTPTGVRCGNRAQHGADVVYHASSQDVRDCYAESGRFQTQARSQAQIAREAERAIAQREAARLARYTAWRTIPVFTRNRAYYALTEPNGKILFFRVERSTKGKSAGRTYIKIQASDDFHDLPWGLAAGYLDRIAAEPDTAALLYGQEIGHCARCNKTLTDPESRALGIGPDCLKKVGR